MAYDDERRYPYAPTTYAQPSYAPPQPPGFMGLPIDIQGGLMAGAEGLSGRPYYGNLMDSRSRQASANMEYQKMAMEYEKARRQEEIERAKLAIENRKENREETKDEATLLTSGLRKLAPNEKSNTRNPSVKIGNSQYVTDERFLPRTPVYTVNQGQLKPAYVGGQPGVFPVKGSKVVNPQIALGGFDIAGFNQLGDYGLTPTTEVNSVNNTAMNIPNLTEIETEGLDYVRKGKITHEQFNEHIRPLRMFYSISNRMNEMGIPVQQQRKFLGAAYNVKSHKEKASNLKRIASMLSYIEDNYGG